jgi:hypothetical protein
MSKLYGWEKPISYIFENYGDAMVTGIEYMIIPLVLFVLIGLPILLLFLLWPPVHRENPVHTLRYKELDKLRMLSMVHNVQRTAEPAMVLM